MELTDQECADLLYESYVADKNLWGRCYVFARALHDVYHYKMEELHDGAPVDHPTSLQHAYCIHPDGRLVDAHGFVNREAVMANEGKHIADPRIVPMTKKKWLTRFRSHPDWLVTRSELFAAKEFVRERPDVYVLGTRTITPWRRLDNEWRSWASVKASHTEALKTILRNLSI